MADVGLFDEQLEMLISSIVTEPIKSTEWNNPGFNYNNFWTDLKICLVTTMHLLLGANLAFNDIEAKRPVRDFNGSESICTRGGHLTCSSVVI